MATRLEPSAPREPLEDAAAAGQLDEALARLGPTRQLADDYLEALQSRPRWAAGILAAGATIAVLILAATALAIAFGSGLDAANTGAGRYELWPNGPFDGQPLVTWLPGFLAAGGSPCPRGRRSPTIP